jgi:hypothetical protein
MATLVVTVSARVAAPLIALAVFKSLTLLIALALMFCIVALIFRCIFRRSYEVHGPIAGVVFMTVLAPISRVIRRNVQVHWRRGSCLRLDQHRLRIDDRRRTIVADLHLAVHARHDLARQHDADVQVARVSAADAGAGAHDRNECDYTHVKNPLKSKWQSGRAPKSSLATAWPTLSTGVKVCTIN